MHVYSYIIYNYMHVHVRNCACDIIIIVYGEYYMYNYYISIPCYDILCLLGMLCIVRMRYLSLALLVDMYTIT